MDDWIIQNLILTRKSTTDNAIALIDMLSFDFSEESHEITISRVAHSRQRGRAGIKARFINKED